MAILINGNGNKAIWAAQDADLIAAICGNVTSIAAVGNQFAATQEDASTIGLADGVIITKEGRRIQLDTGAVDLFTIPTGTAGVTSYYIIGYKLTQQSDTSQICETFVQKMNSASETIDEDTFKGGATEVYVSCYRVTQDGLNISAINGLLPLMNDLVNSGGTKMRVVKHGSVSLGNGSTTASVSFGETLDSKGYIVFLSSDSINWQTSNASQQGGAYVSNYGTTSITISMSASGANIGTYTVGYQIIALE